MTQLETQLAQTLSELSAYYETQIKQLLSVQAQQGLQIRQLAESIERLSVSIGDFQ